MIWLKVVIWFWEGNDNKNGIEGNKATLFVAKYLRWQMLIYRVFLRK